MVFALIQVKSWLLTGNRTQGPRHQKQQYNSSWSPIIVVDSVKPINTHSSKCSCFLSFKLKQSCGLYSLFPKRMLELGWSTINISDMMMMILQQGIDVSVWGVPFSCDVANKFSSKMLILLFRHWYNGFWRPFHVYNHVKSTVKVKRFFR